jgi:hypothetical protein
MATGAPFALGRVRGQRTVPRLAWVCAVHLDSSLFTPTLVRPDHRLSSTVHGLTGHR